MLVKFKNTGRIKDTKAGELFVNLGLAEKVSDTDNELIGVTDVKPVKEKPVKKSVVKKKPAKRGRPKSKK